MKETERIVEQMRRVIEGDAWHGPSVIEIMGRMSSSGAAGKPIAGAHTIWELVLHMTSWTNEVRRRALGAQAAEPVEGDWPSMPAPSEEEWAKAKAALIESHEGLCSTLVHFPPSRLDEIVGDERSAPLGSGVSYYVMLHGLVEHHTYHAGQIALLAKALG